MSDILTYRDAAVQDHTKVTDYARRIGELKSASCRVWINCKQAASIINEFPVVKSLYYYYYYYFFGKMDSNIL